MPMDCVCVCVWSFMISSEPYGFSIKPILRSQFDGFDA